MNELEAARGRRFLGGNNGYNVIKRRSQGIVLGAAKEQGLPRLSGQWHYVYLFREPNRRRDPSNAIGGGVKIVEDALQAGGYIDGDGWKQIASIQPHWVSCPENPGVSIFWSKTRIDKSALEWLQEDIRWER